MHHLLALALSSLLLLTLTTAIPTPSTPHHLARAGGPIAKPIPANCTLTSPLPTTTSTSASNTSTTTNNYAPAPNTTSSSVYSAYYPPASTNQTALFTQCLEQCYGFGTPGTCVAAYLAGNVPAPPLFGSPGGQLETACLMFNRSLTAADFVLAPAGTYTGALSADIFC
ncbi:hypothetical protein AOQ84DRAFT_119457 [Glonium stellatum]|uniref:Uncharacterized protein n=1 Tax=Glonium stellatum TaxID=574774 RepID=A0A8E2ET15_9PEZI|nr:hypothetical protein AOQ84DRAFT_119457 [Glonium stellatum]